MIPPKPRLALVTPFCLPILAGSACAQELAGPIDRAQAQFRQELLSETAGVFWIIAEVAILFCMIAACRIFATRPLPARLSLTPGERRRAARWGAASLVLILAVFGRHLFISPLPEALQDILSSGEDLGAGTRAAYLYRAHVHAAVWCAFITAWVAIEIAIVASGIRAYRNLKRMIATAAAGILAVAVLAAPEAWAQTSGPANIMHAAYIAAIREDELTRRFVELYLRLAGTVWIAVEWIAVVFLALGYRNLRRWFAGGDAV